MNQRFQTDDLIVGKLGTNPWWPGTVVNDSDENGRVFVRFLEIGIESWLEPSCVASCDSRREHEMTMMGIVGGGVPDTMRDAYERSWESFERLQRQLMEREDDDDDKTDRGSEWSDGHHRETNEPCREEAPIADNPCELCIRRELSSSLATKLTKMSLEDREKYFETFMIDKSIDNDSRCANFCRWRYHKRCVLSDNDHVCSCNKSVWVCSICQETITVNQLFVCDNHECMLPFHRTCLSGFFNLSPDTRQCPLHRCINCSLDYLSPSTDDTTTSDSCVKSISLVHCVICKLAFHNDPDCLPAPASFISITPGLIICYRHLVETEQLSSNFTRFCFSCGQAIHEDASIPPVSCKFCPVTYHGTRPCLPMWIELLDKQTFVCNGCRFPYVRRGSNYVLAIPIRLSQSDNVNCLRLGIPIYNGSDKTTLTIRDADGSQYITQVHQTISINLQSIDHLLCFGVLRFNDMQRAIRHLISLVNQLKNRLNLQQSFFRNAFILHFAELFPINENVYSLESPNILPQDVPFDEKCQCTIDSCTTIKCTNVAAKRECSDNLCNLGQRCRNRRLQRRQYPRYRMVVCSDGQNDEKKIEIVLEETVVKDILVTELVGQVKSRSWFDNSITVPYNCVLSLSNESVIDCSQFCSMARFITISDRPNLQPRYLSVAGELRIGLFSTRRIVKGEQLSFDGKCFLTKDRCEISSGDIRPSLISWDRQSEQMEMLSHSQSEPVVIDLCNDEPDRPVDISDTSDDENSSQTQSKAPLCQVCMSELSVEQSCTRLLVHCKGCYSIVHFHCALRSLHSGQEITSILTKFLCPSCTILKD